MPKSRRTLRTRPARASYTMQATYPYFMLDADGDGQPDKNEQGANMAYNAWTPRLLKAAFNYQYSQKDPGAFVHNPQYVIQFLIDSIGDLGGNVSGYTRPEVPGAVVAEHARW